jgi:predicted histone-like DNA-binding protein
MQKYKVTSKKDVAKGVTKYMATTVVGSDKAIGNLEIAKELSAGTSLNITDVLAVIEGLPEAMSRHLVNGEKIHIKGLGFFQNSVTSDLMDKAEDVTPERIRFSKVIFRAENSLRNLVAEKMKAERIESINPNK